jgi:hypothetical protein
MPVELQCLEEVMLDMWLQHFASPLALTGLFIGSVVVMMIAFDSGLRLGHWRANRAEPEPPLSARLIVNSVLRLVSFTLAFTFGLAATHFDSRNQAYDDEAGAIMTAYRRADLIPEPRRSEIKELLRQYVDLRVESSKPEQLRTVRDKLHLLQERLWSEAMPQNATDTQPPAILFQSLNELTLNSERIMTHMGSRIPAVIWLCLYVTTVISCIGAGYHSGITGARKGSIAAVIYALAFSVVLVIIIDADSPTLGQLQESRQAITDLRVRLNSER